MKDDVKKYNKVVAYIRKSSEDNKGGKEHKQLNSIRYQRNFVKEAIKNHDLELVCPVFEDDKTGYEAFVRDDFNKMLKYLEEHEGEVDGIVCTEISRLARNFGDGGLLLWYMQSGVIKRIYTATKTFTDSSSDQLMVAIEFAMSKKSSDETGYRTREGMKTKARIMGHPARPAILGYMTRGPVGRKKWIIDPETGPLVKQVFEQFASSIYTFNPIL
ncbi:recombinase family protein [Patescibacteria group bacterium]|nr:recombinase family protein [Patescibacteria group bacterium]